MIDDISIWDGLTNLGEANTLNQSLQANYELPFKKIAPLSFIKSTYSYNGDFQWRKGSDVFDNLVITNDDGEQETVPDLGNTIQNSRSHRLNTAFDLKKFYKSVGLVKKTSNRKKKKKKKKKDTLQVANTPKVAPRTIDSKKKLNSKKLKPSIKLYNTLIGGITCLLYTSPSPRDLSTSRMPSSA